MTNLTLERNLDVVREILRVNPARPKSLDEQTHGAGFYSANGRNSLTDASPDIEMLVETWKENALKVAAQAAELAEKYFESPTAWTRSAFAHLVIGHSETAGAHARKAISVARGKVTDNSPIDVPAVAGAIRVLSTIISIPELVLLLEDLPRETFLTGILASLVASTGDIDKALALSEQIPKEEAASLLGYLRLQKNELSQAIHSLRVAIAYNSMDVDAYFNLAIALFRSNSPKKALRSAAIAHRLSPGRLDIRNFYHELLAVTRNWESLKSEILKLRKDRVEDTPEILIAEARLALFTSNRERALGYLKSAERLAIANGNFQLGQEMKGNQITLSFACNKVNRETAKKQMLTLLEAVPDSLVLVEMFSRLSNRRSDAKVLEKYLARHLNSESTLAFSFRSRLAHSQCRFSDYLTEVRLWVKTHPSDSNALMALLIAEGYFGDDWPKAAVLARLALRKFPISAHLVNQAAYSLALAGQAFAADDLLKRFHERDYQLEATVGLVKICLGEMALGLKHYRKAADMVDKSPNSEQDSMLMGIHQGLALRRLNLINPDNEKLLKAAALPVVTLPEDWDEYPNFVALKFVADRNGWSWPPLLD